MTSTLSRDLEIDRLNRRVDDLTAQLQAAKRALVREHDRKLTADLEPAVSFVVDRIDTMLADDDVVLGNGHHETIKVDVIDLDATPNRVSGTGWRATLTKIERRGGETLVGYSKPKLWASYRVEK